MVETWYALVAITLVLYVVLDGFDLGAGAVHLFVARNAGERRQVIEAIGPYWDGNEVWLLAGGGALFVAFPAVLAAGLSGFYLAIFLVLWCLLGRGLAIEARGHVADGLWQSFWDVVFAGASTLLAVFLGAALGNLLRGVPLRADGWFSLALFTDFRATAPVGLLDWYTVLSGLYALAALALHGAVFLAWKTAGVLRARCLAFARPALGVVALGWIGMTVATASVNPVLFAHVRERPLAWVAVAIAGGGLSAVVAGLWRGRALGAFLGSCAFLAGLLGATAAALFPTMLRATGNESLSLTAFTSHSDVAGLRTALAWWSLGFPLALLYLGIIFRLHRGAPRTPSPE